MDKLITIWSFICRRKYLITVVAFAVIIGFLDENSLFRRLGYERRNQPAERRDRKIPSGLRREHQTSQRVEQQSGCYRTGGT